VSAVVSDSSPLNYLALLSDFGLLRQIYHTLVIPPAVHREVVESGRNYPVSQAVEAALGDWISVAEPPGPAQVAALRREFGLDPGESEAKKSSISFASTGSGFRTLTMSRSSRNWASCSRWLISPYNRISGTGKSTAAQGG